MSEIKLIAQKRDANGRGASRRLRRNGMVPAIIYGLGKDALAITVDHNFIYHALKKPVFHTSILNIEIDGKVETTLLRDFQIHPYKQLVLHLDFQRVSDKEEVQISVPLNFINEDVCHAVKVQGAHITHIVTEVEIRALPKHIPESIDVDLKDVAAGQSIHLSNLILPNGVTLVNLLRGEDSVVVTAAGINEEKDEDQALVSAADIPTVSGKAVE